MLSSLLVCSLFSVNAVAENAVSTLSDAALYDLYREEFDNLEHNYVEQQTAIRVLNVENASTEPQAVSMTIPDGENAVITLTSIMEKVPNLRQTRSNGIDSTDVYVCARIYIRTEYDRKLQNGKYYVWFARGIGRVLNYYDGYSGNGVVVTYGNSGYGGNYSTTYTLLSSQSYDFESYHDLWVAQAGACVGQSAAYKFRRAASTSDTVVEVDCHYWG